MGKDGNANQTSINNNRYATKKTIAQGLLDLALLLANANQLKTVLQEGKTFPNYTLLIVLISVSISFQLVAGLCMLIVGTMDLNNPKREKIVEMLNNAVTGLVLVVTIINIAITSFELEHDAGVHSPKS